MYAQIKSILYGAIPTDWDAAQIIVGYIVLLITLLVFRQSIKAWWAFLPVLIVGLLIEIADMVLLGQAIGTAARDLVLFTILPLVTVFAFRMGWTK
ncbi:MAG: hypothetical protein VR70_15505 [Rhodospirillaceae bacterium BRH_c57]|nr:MAG: hypothetical protein VR70_15505 [Rhodospirillaceae bacterium BRH_c57]